MVKSDISILDRISIDDLVATTGTKKEPNPDKNQKFSHDPTIICANILAPIFWAYIIVNTFVVNLDSLIKIDLRAGRFGLELWDNLGGQCVNFGLKGVFQCIFSFL